MMQQVPEGIPLTRKDALQKVKESGQKLYILSDVFKKDREIVKEAVRQCGWSIHHASTELQQDAEIVNLAANWAKACYDGRLAGMLSRITNASPELCDELKRMYGHLADFSP